MEKLKKGYCFEGADQNRFLIVGDAINQENGQLVYLCQELTGEYRLMIWTAQAILGEKTAEVVAADMADSGKSDKGGTEKASSKRFAGIFRRECAPEKTAETGESSEMQLQEMMIRFLEAPSCSEKLELLDLMKGKVTESMLESMAISMDYELGGGSVEEKYYALERFLKTRNRYEGSRLR